MEGQVKPYYADSLVTIYHGDCREIAIDRADCLISDPPYAEQTHKGARSVTASRALVDFYCISPDTLAASLAAHAPKRWCVCTIDWRHAVSLEATPPAGLRFVRLGVWVKPNGAPQFTGDRPATGWEAVGILHGEDVPLRWNGGGHHAVWTHNKFSGVHPTQKPLSLVKEWVRLFSDAGETVLDPFCGSGTTLRAAKDLGRRAIGIEIEEKYCAIAAERCRQEVLAL